MGRVVGYRIITRAGEGLAVFSDSSISLSPGENNDDFPLSYLSGVARLVEDVDLAEIVLRYRDGFIRTIRPIRVEFSAKEAKGGEDNEY